MLTCYQKCVCVCVSRHAVSEWDEQASISQPKEESDRSVHLLTPININNPARTNSSSSDEMFINYLWWYIFVMWSQSSVLCSGLWWKSGCFIMSEQLYIHHIWFANSQCIDLFPLCVCLQGCMYRAVLKMVILKPHSVMPVLDSAGV